MKAEKLRETVASNDAAGIQARDPGIKKILSFILILGRIVKAVVPEFADMSPKEIADHIVGYDRESGDEYIRGDNTEFSNSSGAKTIFDLLYTIRLPGSGKRILFDLEPQGLLPDYPLWFRVDFYLGQMIVEQRKTGVRRFKYRDIEKSYSVWILTDPRLDPFAALIRFEMKDLFGENRIPSGYNLEEGIVLAIGRYDEFKDIADDIQDREFRWIAGVLETVLSPKLGTDEKLDVLSKEFGIPVGGSLSRAVDKMDGWLQPIVEDSFQEGIQKGVQKGIGIGKAQGIQEGVQKVAANMLKAGMTPKEISKLTGLSSEEVERLAETA